MNVLTWDTKIVVAVNKSSLKLKNQVKNWDFIS